MNADIKILIVDDDVYIGDMVAKALIKQGYEPVRAYSGTEALLVLENVEPDGILLDLMLPGLNGEELIRQSNRAAMARVFGNIIGNALKYSDGDFFVELFDDGQIIFKNHAANLDKLRVEKLFDRFYTVQEARGSTGLGLSIARSLVEQLGGSIGAEYEDGVLKIEMKT